MRKLIAVLIMMLACCSIALAEDVNEPDEFISVWVSGTDLAYQNTNLSAWLGFRRNLNEEFDIEVGPALSWRTWTEEDSPDEIQSDLAVGAFAAVHFIDLVEIPNPLAEYADWMPDVIAGEPFFSIEYLIDTESRGASFSPGTGMRLFDIMAIQYKWRMIHGEPIDDEGVFAISAKFKI